MLKLARINELSQTLESKVPFELIDLVDQGGNPDLFSRGYMEHTLAENQYAKGKLAALGVG